MFFTFVAKAGNGSGTMVSFNPDWNFLGTESVSSFMAAEAQNEKSHICWARGYMPGIESFRCESADVNLNEDVGRFIQTVVMKCPGSSIQIKAFFSEFRTGGQKPIKGIRMEAMMEDSSRPKGKEYIAALRSQVSGFNPEIIASEFQSPEMFFDFKCYRK